MDRIALRIALAMLPVLIVLLTLFSVATAWREGEVIELEMQRDANNVAATIAALLNPTDEEQTTATLEALDRALPYLTIGLTNDPPLPAEGGGVVGVGSLGPDGPWIVVREPLEERDAFVRRALTTDSVGVVVATLLAAAFAVAVGRVLVQARVVTLVHRLRAVGSGDYNATPLELGADEIGDLGREVVAMTEQLKAARDHTDREVAARRRAQLQLRRADRLASVGRTVAVFAHEVGTPLAVIGGRAQRLERPPHTDKVQTDAATIREQVDRISTFVRKLLDYARHDDSLEFTAVRPSVAVATAISLVEDRAHAANVELIVEDHAGPCLVDGDAQGLAQVFTNLLQNAVDASPPQSTITVTMTLDKTCTQRISADSPTLHVRVHDQGAGIPDSVRERIFDPFFTTKPAGEGTGLGLSIVTEIVHDHGGSVTLAAVDAGTCFVVHLPASGGSATNGPR